ncbi:MAG: ABC transporter ATP-binding protein [Candidatus Omnitrophica bacterium]|nr:ABC transporter ATP-binding protein [Candidatus Omnitrophota bacterium]
MFKEYKRLYKFVKPHASLLWMAIFSMFVCSLTSSISIGMLIPFVDRVIANRPIILSENAHIPAFFSGLISRLNAIDALLLLKGLIVFGVFVFLLSQAFEYLRAYFMNKLGYRFLKDIRDEMYDKILNLSVDFFYKNPTGKLTSKILIDTSIIKDSLIEGLTDLIYQPIQLVFYFVLIILVMVWFGMPVTLVLVVLGLTGLVIFPVVKIGKRIRKITHLAQESVAGINTTVFEAITGISIVHGFSMEEYELNRLKKQNTQYFKYVMKSVKRMIAIGPILEFVAFFCSVIVVWVGVSRIVSQTLSAGAFLAFFGALLSLLRPFKKLSRIYAINQQAMAAAERVFDVLDAKSSIVEKAGAGELGLFEKDISYEGVNFGYNPQEPVLKDINIRVEKGEIAAFVGPSGVGKTTLLNLLPRFYDPQKGAIRIGGIDTKEVTLKSLRANVGIVAQDPFLFNDTVAQNIAYGRDVKSNMENIIKAAKASNSHNFIMDMPDGYDTVIGERGFRLSGGEKQRLCIARAIFKNPPILILDEATSQLDTESELLVQDAIDRLMAGRTVLVIAHRLSTIKHATRIYVLENGRVAETGSHDELMSRSGLYNKLYNLQFKLA